MSEPAPAGAGTLGCDGPSAGILADAQRFWPALVCWGIPVSVMLGAYAWLAIDRADAMLWHVVVHEGGQRTLAATVLYFPHFLREVPIDIAMALFVLAAADRSPVLPPRENGRAVAGAAAIAASVLLVLAAFAATAAADGLPSALRDLGQYRTRDSTHAFGSHWHYHWLSTLWFGLAAGAGHSLLFGERRRPTVGANPFAVLAWGYFLGMTLVFGLTDKVFFSTLYAGHQAREIATHAAITLPLALGSIGLLSNGRIASPRLGRRGKLRIAAMLLIAAWLAAVMAAGDVMAEGQSANGLSAMVGGHIFEHSLDYLAVLLLVCGVALFSRRGEDAAEGIWRARPEGMRQRAHPFEA